MATFTHTRSGTRIEFVAPSLWRHKLIATWSRHSGTPHLRLLTLSDTGLIFAHKLNKYSQTKDQRTEKCVQTAAFHLGQVPAWTDSRPHGFCRPPPLSPTPVPTSDVYSSPTPPFSWTRTKRHS